MFGITKNKFKRWFVELPIETQNKLSRKHYPGSHFVMLSDLEIHDIYKKEYKNFQKIDPH